MQSGWADPPTARSRRRSRFALTIVALGVLVIVGWFVVRPRLLAGTGDPGGSVMAQLVPAASALPGYGTSSLPWASEPSLNAAYLVKMEPHQDSCDGMAGTQGWSPVVVQGGFEWLAAPQSLLAQVGVRMAALQWTPTTSLPTEADWSKRLANGSRAVASLGLQAGTSWWEFVVQGPPAGKASTGC